MEKYIHIPCRIYILYSFSYIITINKKLSEYLSQTGIDHNNISVIKSGVDLEKYNPKIDGSNIREIYGIKKEDNVLFFMGWLYHFSGLKEVALELAEGNDDTTKLLIVGEGDAFEDLKKIKDKYDTNNQIILTGNQPYEKIRSNIYSYLKKTMIDDEIVKWIKQLKDKSNIEIYDIL